VLFGARPMSEKVSRSAFLLYILFLQLASAHHILVDPGISSEWKVFNTSYAMYLAVLASMIHGLTVPGSVEVAQRAKGYTKGICSSGCARRPGVTRYFQVSSSR
jgi:cytochrome c oxidase subunit 1